MKTTATTNIFLKFFLPTILIISWSSCGDKPSPTPTPTPSQVTISSFTITNVGTTTATANFTVANATSVKLAVNGGTPIDVTGASTYALTGLTPNTGYNVALIASNPSSPTTSVTQTQSFTTNNVVITPTASATLAQPVITVSSFRALQLNACTNQDFKVTFANGNGVRTLNSATFTLSGTGAGAYRSIRYRPTGDFTKPWVQLDFNSNAVSIPFAVSIPANSSVVYDLKVCTRTSASGATDGAATNIAVTSISTDEPNVTVPVGGTFQSAIALPTIDLATTATSITSLVNNARTATSRIMSANQTQSQAILTGMQNIKATGPSGATFTGIVLKNQYGNSNVFVTGGWFGVIDIGATSNIFVSPTANQNGDYYSTNISGAPLQTNGNNTHYLLLADIKAGPGGFNSGTGFGFSLRSKWDVAFRNSSGNDINLTDVTVQDNGVALTN